MDIDKTMVSVLCPNCGYGIEIRLQQVRLQERVICSCCKNNVQLIDKDASVEISKQNIDTTLKDFKKTMNDLSKTLKIDF